MKDLEHILKNFKGMVNEKRKGSVIIHRLLEQIYCDIQVTIYSNSWFIFYVPKGLDIIKKTAVLFCFSSFNILKLITYFTYLFTQVVNLVKICWSQAPSAGKTIYSKTRMIPP